MADGNIFHDLKPSFSPKSVNFDQLRKKISGDFFDDSFNRARYATDASIYQMMPHAVVVPKTFADLEACVEFARANEIALLPRGGGTSQCGQTVNNAIVLDYTKYLNKVTDLDAQNHRCTVEPGIVLDDLNRQLKPHGLWFPVDVSTSSRATIGGMTANNSCGGRSIRYGIMRDNVISISALLADGSTANFGKLGDYDKLPEGRLGEIQQTLLSIGLENKSEILSKFPKVLRRVGGYNIDSLIPDGMALRPDGKPGDGINLAHLLVGSEGTLAVFKTITLKLSPLPGRKVMGLCHFPTFYQAMDTAQHLVKLGPVAVELIDSTMIELARSISLFKPTVEKFVQGNPAALLVVEFADEDPEFNQQKLSDLQSVMGELGYSWKNSGDRQGGVVALSDLADQALITEMRKSGLNIMMSMKDEAKPVSFVEDCAVELSDLADYTDQLTKIFKKYGTTGTWYAHASVGCLHVRPVLNMKLQGGAAAMRGIAEEAFALVKKYGGSHSGEHGDGIARSEFHEVMFGKKMTELFKDVKTLFDPQNIMNPGKITDAPKMDDRSLFRYAPGYSVNSFPTKLNWSAWPGSAGGLQGAVEMCNNNGSCRKLNGGVMCPSFRVTGNEMDSTRGRANSLRMALSGQLGADALASADMADTMKLCVSCKGCKRECPTGVDMARMKIEVTALQTERHGLSLHDKLIAYLPDYAPYATKLADVLNLRDRIPFAAIVSEKITGFTAKRPLPKWQRDYFKQGELPEHSSNNGRPVILFADTFNRYFEPENLRAATRVLRASGYDVFAPPASVKQPLCCGRTFLSTGMIERARSEASRLIASYMPFAEAGIPIVGLEPSCLLALRDEVPALLNNAASRKVAEMAMTFEELLVRDKPMIPLEAANQRALLHGHCHQKAFNAVKPIEEVLSWIEGLEVNTVETSCCGMAGAFGYGADTYDVSMQMANANLLPAVRDAELNQLIIADGTSCRCQIKDGANRTAQHVALVLDNYLKDSN